MLLIQGLVLLVLGFLLGEFLDVWYDGRVLYDVRTKEALIFEPAPLYFGQIKYIIQFKLPEAYEHYHWGVWLLAVAVVANTVVSEFTEGFVMAMIGVAVSLIMDENRVGIGGHPFGIGKDFTRLSLALGFLIISVSVGLYFALLPQDFISVMVLLLLPLWVMPLIGLMESKGILKEPWPNAY